MTTRAIRTFPQIPLVATLVLWGGIGNAIAADLEVGPTRAYTAISPAIDDAGDGDTIRIDPGTYDESIVVGNRALNIVGIGGSAQTQIGPGNASQLATIRIIGGDRVTLQGLTIDGGNDHRGIATTEEPTLVTHGATLIGTDLVFVNGTDDLGLYVGGSDLSFDGGPSGGLLELTGCQFTDPTSTLGYGGHAFVLNASLTLTDCLFEGGSATEAGFGGGGLATFDVSGVIRRTTFADNEGFAGGGAVVNDPDGVVTFEDCNFIENHATFWGGAFNSFGSPNGELRFLRNTLVGNTSGQTGGGLDITGVGIALVEDCIIADQTSTIEGAGLWINDVGAATVRRSVFTRNVAVERGGGGLRALQSNLQIEGTTFCDNAGDQGGAIDTVGQASVVVQNSILQLNQSNDGSAIYVGNSSTLVTDHATLVDNGTGSVAAIATSSTGHLEVSNSAFVANASQAIEARGSLEERYNLYWDHTAAPLGGAPLDGTDLESPPSFVRHTEDCSDDLRPTATSPLIDAGDPLGLDVDGTPQDIGAYGGPDAPAFFDVDGDGWIVDDCGPYDPDVFPGSTEIPADGIDQDCDGSEICHVDADGDGLGTSQTIPGSVDCGAAGESLSPDDCDDLDPTIGADCSGAPFDPRFSEERILPRGWHCGVGPSLTGSGVGLVAVGLLCRRRRRTRA